MRNLPNVNDVLNDIHRIVADSQQEKVASQPSPASEFTTELAAGIYKLASRLREAAATPKPSFEMVKQLGDRILSSNRG